MKHAPACMQAELDLMPSPVLKERPRRGGGRLGHNSFDSRRASLAIAQNFDMAVAGGAPIPCRALPFFAEDSIVASVSKCYHKSYDSRHASLAIAKNLDMAVAGGGSHDFKSATLGPRQQMGWGSLSGLLCTLCQAEHVRITEIPMLKLQRMGCWGMMR